MPYIFRIILLGNANVGKTTLLASLANRPPPITYESTIGVDFATYSTTIDNDSIKAHIWDTAGQEYYFSITSRYFKDIAGAVFVFDISNPKSFQNIKYWLKQIQKYNKKPIKMLLIGNKNDLPRKVKYTEAHSFALQHDMIYYETCALNHTLEPFNQLLSNIYRHLPNHIPSGIGIKRLTTYTTPEILPPNDDPILCCNIL
tara:strand:- start:206 stop:808 length:603 start_codon:yes stop_codon:yes gene_type:complete